jgi:hypothetical protein
VQEIGQTTCRSKQFDLLGSHALHYSPDPMPLGGIPPPLEKEAASAPAAKQSVGACQTLQQSTLA